MNAASFPEIHPPRAGPEKPFHDYQISISVPLMQTPPFAISAFSFWRLTAQ
jgi:hypothetical protein